MRRACASSCGPARGADSLGLQIGVDPDQMQAQSALVPGLLGDQIITVIVRVPDLERRLV
jgi:hypothetical protein